MMEELTSKKKYPALMAEQIEAMGPIAISIANRWMMGWPERVCALLVAGVFMENLEAQVDQEKEVLANEASLRHLSPREIRQMYEIREAPPAMEEKNVSGARH